jgi:hypothetical protein
MYELFDNFYLKFSAKKHLYLIFEIFIKVFSFEML